MIGIIAAMQAEVDALLEWMEDASKWTKDGICFWQGKVKNQSVVLMLSGVGKGNAAMSCTLLLKNYDVEAVINIGTAGGLRIEEQVLDLVISERIVQHDYDSSFLDGPSGIGLWYEADPRLRSLCKEICTLMQERYHYGLIASGDQFAGEKTQVEQLLARFPEAMCAEMEAGAIAQVCTHFQVPFVVIRSLSDIALHEENNLTFCDYVSMASKRSAKLCVAMIEKWNA